MAKPNMDYYESTQRKSSSAKINDKGVRPCSNSIRNSNKENGLAIIAASMLGQEPELPTSADHLCNRCGEPMMLTIGFKHEPDLYICINFRCSDE